MKLKIITPDYDALAISHLRFSFIIAPVPFAYYVLY